jgi:MFS family permease
MAPPTTASTSLVRNRSFNLLWGSQFLSGLGTAISGIAFPLLILATTGSAIHAGIVGTVAAVVRLALRIPSGVVVDRVDRKRLMIGCDAIRLCAYVGLALLVASGRAGLVAIIVLAGIDAVCGSFFETAELAALRNVVGVEQIPLATARNAAREQAASLIGPPLGGVLFAAARAVPFLADAVSYAASLVGIAFIGTPLQQERTQRSQGALADVREGLRFCWNQPVVRATILMAPPLNLAINGLIFAGIIILRKDGLAPGLVGLFETILGVGGLLGAIVAGPMQRWLSMRALVFGIAWATVVLVAAASFLTGSLLLAAPLAATFFLSPAVNAALFGYIGAVTPDALQGRVMSVLLTGAMSMASLSPLLAGVFYETLGARGTVYGFAAVTAVSAVGATASRVLRSMSGKPADESARAAAAVLEAAAA